MELHDGQRHAGALETGLDIVELLTDIEQPLGVSEIARRLGMDKGHAHRTLAVLRQRGFVVQDETSRRYSPGLRIISLARSVLQGQTIWETAAAPLRKLWSDAEESVHIACLNIDRVIYLWCLHGPTPVTVMTSVGSQAPTHCTATGKALIANLPSPALKEHVARISLTTYTPRTIVDPAELMRHLEEVRRRGYATDDEEFHPGVRCLAAPIFDFGNEVVASVGVSGPSYRLTTERLLWLSRLVQSTAAQISQCLGFDTGDQLIAGRI